MLRKEVEEVSLKENIETIIVNFKIINSYINLLTPKKFVENAKKAFVMIIEAAKKKDQKTLETLIDKRFLSKFEDLTNHYTNFKTQNIDAKISDAYTFTQNVLFIKILFSCKGFSEEWTFSKHVREASYSWYLSEISTPQ